MMCTGGRCFSITRTCTGEVWVRSTTWSLTKKVSCSERAGWSAGVLRASKL